MRQADARVPPLPERCQRCHDPLPRPVAVDLIVEYNTHPDHPAQSMIWVCLPCRDEDKRQP